MGVYDKLEYCLRCKNCGAEERIIFLDQGSGWGFSDWSPTGPVNHFEVKITDGEVTKPAIEIKNCKACAGKDVELRVE